jgi:hypothetical protein
LAVDSADGIACTTVEDDAGVEFYNLAIQSGFSVELPASEKLEFQRRGRRIRSHVQTVSRRPAHSSSASSGSSIYAYDINGNLQETINGFSFSNAFNVVPMHIALHPSLRTGYADGPSANVNQIQSFTY